MPKLDYSKVVTKSNQGYKVLHGTYFEKHFNSKNDAIIYLNRIIKECENLNRFFIIHCGYMLVQDVKYIDLVVIVLGHCQRSVNILKFRSTSYHIHLVNNTLQAVSVLIDCPVFQRFSGVIDSFMALR